VQTATGKVVASHELPILTKVLEKPLFYAMIFHIYTAKKLTDPMEAILTISWFHCIKMNLSETGCLCEHSV
jgi:hypothetical protein